MMAINLIFMFKILTQYLSLEDFLAYLTGDGSRRDRDYVWRQWEVAVDEHGADFSIIINDKVVLNWEDFPHHAIIRHFNNRLASLLKIGIEEITIYHGSDAWNALKDIKLILKLIDGEVAFDVNRHDCEGSFAGLNILNGQQREPLISVIEEFLKLKRMYRKIFEDALHDLVPPTDYERMMSITFNQVNVFRGKGYNDWLPLEQAWSDYKKQHNITDEDVKKAITEEEEKDKLLRKNKRKWWKFK